MLLRVSSETGFASPGFWKAIEVQSCPIVPGWGRARGNASFVVGTDIQTYGVAYPSQHPEDGPEVRGYACSRGSTYIGPIVSCSTHLTFRHVVTTQAQSYEFAVYSVFNPISNADFRIMAGDFNLAPTQLLSVYPTSFVAMASGATFPTPSPATKIDYIHVQNPNVNSQTATRLCAYSKATISDHCYVHGAYQ